MALGSGSQGVKKLLSERGTRSSLMLQVQVPVVVPSFFVCPISLELMRDPVTLCTGITYDRASIQKWLGFGHNRCPATNQILATEELIPNHTLRRLIQNWCVANKANGVERIPTPKAPVEFDAVKELLHYIAQCNSTETSSMATPLKQLRSLAQECERNRKRIAEAGAVAILAAALAKLRTDMDMDIDRNRSWEVEACEDALATIVVVLHLSNGDGGKKAMSEPKTLWCLSFVLQSGSVEARANAADVIYRVCEEDPRVKVAVGDLPGAIQGLVELLAEDGYPRAVEAGLRSLLSVCLPRRNRAIAVACSSISVLVALLPASEKRHKELAFALLEVLANCAEGREAISNHALALPVIVKSMLGVSPRATEHAVAALWVVLSYASNRSVVTRALQAGACANLLLLLPSECSLRVKHKARDSLKLLSEVGGSCLPCRSPLDHSTVAKHRHRAHVYLECTAEATEAAANSELAMRMHPLALQSPSQQEAALLHPPQSSPARPQMRL